MIFPMMKGDVQGQESSLARNSVPYRSMYLSCQTDREDAKGSSSGVVPCPPERVLSRDDKKSHEMPWLQDETSLGMLNTSTWVAGVDMESVLNEMESYLPPPPSCSQSMSSEGSETSSSPSTAAEGGAEARLIIDAQIKQEQEDVDGMCSVEDMPMSPPISEIPTLPSDFRPQPMHRKAAKHYVPKEQKDDKYWAKRAKNNLAAKRSRDTRRIKENHIILRASFLEEENLALKREVERIQNENHVLKKQLNHLEGYHSN